MGEGLGEGGGVRIHGEKNGYDEYVVVRCGVISNSKFLFDEDPVKMKIKDLAFAMEESGEGRAVTVAVGVTIVVVLLLAVHLGRVVATR